MPITCTSAGQNFRNASSSVPYPIPVIYVPNASNQTYSIWLESSGTGTPQPFARATDLEMLKSFNPLFMKLKTSFLRDSGIICNSPVSISPSSLSWYFDSLKK